MPVGSGPTFSLTGDEAAMLPPHADSHSTFCRFSGKTTEAVPLADSPKSQKILDFSPKSSFSPSSRPSGFLPGRVERDSIFSMSAGGGFPWVSMFHFALLRGRI